MRSALSLPRAWLLGSPHHSQSGAELLELEAPQTVVVVEALARPPQKQPEMALVEAAAANRHHQQPVAAAEAEARRPQRQQP